MKRKMKSITSGQEKDSPCFGVLIAIAFALVGNLFENLIQLINIIGSLFYGTILGIFLIAIFLKTIKANAVFYAAILTEIIVLIVHSQQWVSFLWLNVIGALLTVMIAHYDSIYL